MSDRVLEATKLQIIIVDNEAMANVYRSAGFRSVRVVTKPEQVCTIKDGEAVTDPQFSFFSTVFLAFGEGNEDLRDAVAVRIGDLKCRWIPAHSTEPPRDRIANARPMWTDEVCLLSDVPEHKAQQTYRTGFDELDAHGFRIVRPAFWPVIGPYGSGKSVLMRQLCCNLYRLHGWRTLMTSFEEKIRPRFERDLRRHLIGSEQMDNHGEIHWRPKMQNQWTQADIEESERKINDGFRFLRRPRNKTMDMDRLIDRIEYAVKVYGVDVVVIDPVNEIDHQVARGESKTDYMGRFIMRLKQLADDYDLVMIVCAHPPKDGVEKRGQKAKIYTLNDGADTAHYGNKADIGWCVWRPTLAADGPTYLNIDKLKDHDTMGHPTLAKLQLNSMFGSFAVTKVGYEAIAEELAQ